MPRLVTFSFTFMAFLVLGWHVASGNITPWMSKPQNLYFRAASVDDDSHTTIVPRLISWQRLLGEADKVLMADLQQKQLQLQQDMANNPEENFQLDAQLLASVIKADTWQALDGYQINKAMSGQYVRIPGFVVPLESQQQTLYSFFIVPYFGACLHFPPPPPNQLIYVQYEAGVPLPDIDTPFVFEGQLQAELFEDLLGTSAWSLTLSQMLFFDGDTDPGRLHR